MHSLRLYCQAMSIALIALTPVSDPSTNSERPKPAIEVFICYSHQDEEWREALENHLASLQKQGKILPWHDRAIEAGQEWAAEIKAHLESAQIILLLISSDAIASTLYDQEMQWAIERHQAGKARVIPIILRPVDWNGTPFSHLTALPTDGKPVTTWANPDAAFFNVAQEIRRVVDRLAAGTPIAALDQRPCPYRGLFAFRQEDAALFFGRGTYIEDLVQRVKTKPLVAVVGASGSGKSSLVFAGLLPNLSGNWRVYCLRPGSPDKRPFHNLAAALFPLPSQGNLADHLLQRNQQAEALQKGELTLQDIVGDLMRQTPTPERVLLVVDQFEELYTLCPEADRQPFIEFLLAGVQQDDRCKVVLTLRADFCAQAYAYRALADALQDADLKLSSMNREELRSAIEQPAADQGVQLEPGLADRILNDVSQEPGHLPLLEFALTQLWALQQQAQQQQTQQQQTLTHQGYEAIGGVKKALATHAENVYSNLSADQQQQVEPIFLQLVQLNEGAEDSRRLATRQEVGDNHWPLAADLAGQEARLVVTGRNEQTGEETVEVVHEALIREWQRFQDWITNNRQQLYQKRRIEAAAIEWRNQNRSKDYLWQGRPLTDARRFSQPQTEQLALSQLAQEFIQKGLRQRFWNRLKQASWLIVPTVAIGLMGEAFLREQSVKRDYGRLNASPLEERQAIVSLVEGCAEGRQFRGGPLGGYIAERLFGNCRSLSLALLEQANLSRANLNFADLSRANLSDANLNLADLSRANLSDANLSSADLNFTNLSDANLSNANLNDANLSRTNLGRANLSFTNFGTAALISADLSRANLIRADLIRVNLNSANLSYANLSFTNLSYANLSYANLSFTNLSDADLSDADLSFTNLSDANLSNANLSDADLSYTNFSSADLSSADLSSADLSSANLENTILLNANLSNSKGLQPDQLTGSDPPLLCATKLPPEMAALSDRDCN